MHYDKETVNNPKYNYLKIDDLGNANVNQFGSQTTRSFIDQAARQRVSQPIPLGDYKLINDRLPLFFDTETIGTANVAYDSALKAHNMTTAADDDAAIVQTFMYHNYFSGKAQLIEFTSFNFEAQTNIIKRSGYFRSNEATPFNSDLDGVFIEASGGTHYLNIYNNGTQVASIAQADWDDPLDGTGESKITLDWSKFNVFQINFLWLGGTGLTLSVVIGKSVVEVHNYVHANSDNADTLIFSSPNQPVRHEIRQTGAGAGTFKPVCSTVITEGSSDSANIGAIRSVNTGTSPITSASAGTDYLIKAIRLKDTQKDVTIDVFDFEAFGDSANDSFRWKILLNPTITGTLTWSDVEDSAVQEATGNGTITVTGGYEISSGYGATKSGQVKPLKSARKIGSTIDGVRDIIVLVVSPIGTASNIATYGGLSYKEFV